MDAMEAQLRETYAARETEDLIELSLQGGLTATAQRVLREELERRAVAPSAIAAEEVRQATVASRKLEVQSHLATVLSRVIAAVIDQVGSLFILAGFNFIVYVTTPKGVSDLIGWISILGWLAYIFFKDGFNGQSIGKRLLRIRVVDKEEGTPCTLPKSFLRGLVGMLGLIDWVFALGTSRQRLADHAANTVVVRA
jgi:uncharacterized RDD family membrane protein YckC